MKNRGQTTVLFSCMISILIIFALTALEAGRIYCGKVKIRAVVHSAQSGIMADYNRELFERYHLLFIDPTYGTGSDAMAEERFKGYLEESLNGRDNSEKIYNFSVEEVALVNKTAITDEHMKDLKKQIVEYEKEEGAIKKVLELGKNMADTSGEIEKAGEKTERNAVELPSGDTSEAGEGDGTGNGGTAGDTTGQGTTGDGGDDAGEEVEDPREVLKNNLKLGILALVMPEHAEVSKEEQDFSEAVSNTYKDKTEDTVDNEFTDVSKLVKQLKGSSLDNDNLLLKAESKAAFCAYVTDHFSYQGKSRGSVMKCEVEYILKGKNNDYDNLSAVVSDIIWMRMPVNYVCILQDAGKQSEALTLATAICSATGTMPMVEIVKYLLLGCWSYGESIYEVRQLMHGNKLPYVKTSANWNTDLKTLAKTGTDKSVETGMDYKDYLCVMLARKEGKDITYARMLDMIEKNLQRNNENLSVVNLCGSLTIEGKITMNPLLTDRGDEGVYEYGFEEMIEY